MPPTYYRGCWHVVSRDLFLRYRPVSSPRKAVYNPKAFFPHAASLHQAFAHCARFLTAAARRRRDRVSVPVWGATLSRPLPVVGLVGHYPTNYLIGRRPIPERRSFSPEGAYAGLSVVSNGYPPLWGRFLRVTHPSATQLPLPKHGHCVRLACVKHAASVHPEPGSNSLFRKLYALQFRTLAGHTPPSRSARQPPRPFVAPAVRPKAPRTVDRMALTTLSFPLFFCKGAPSARVTCTLRRYLGIKTRPSKAARRFYHRNTPPTRAMPRDHRVI